MFVNAILRICGEQIHLFFFINYYANLHAFEAVLLLFFLSVPFFCFF